MSVVLGLVIELFLKKEPEFTLFFFFFSKDFLHNLEIVTFLVYIKIARFSFSYLDINVGLVT